MDEAVHLRMYQEGDEGRFCGAVAAAAIGHNAVVAQVIIRVTERGPDGKPIEPKVAAENAISALYL